MIALRSLKCIAYKTPRLEKLFKWYGSTQAKARQHPKVYRNIVSDYNRFFEKNPEKPEILLCIKVQFAEIWYNDNQICAVLVLCHLVQPLKCMLFDFTRFIMRKISIFYEKTSKNFAKSS